jgi:hypothetical protein
MSPFFLNLGIIWRATVNLVVWLLYPQEETSVPIELLGGWAPEPVWTVLKKRKYPLYWLLHML